MDNKNEKKFDLYNNYYWGFLGFFISIIGVILVFAWFSKYEKTVKGLLIGIFFNIILLVVLLGIFASGR